MKKGCIFVLGGLIALIALIACCIGVIYFMAAEYEKGPMAPGERELSTAEDFIRSFEGVEADGNTPEAVEFGKRFARDLRVSREALFTEGKAGGVSLTKGYFVTYCFLTEDSLAIIVHVPELRRYTNEAKISLAEFAWSLASLQSRKELPKVRRLALGIKGMLNYSSIFIGAIEVDGDPIDGIQKRDAGISTEILYPFFTKEE